MWNKNKRNLDFGIKIVINLNTTFNESTKTTNPVLTLYHRSCRARFLPPSEGQRPGGGEGAPGGDAGGAQSILQDGAGGGGHACPR